MLCNDRIHVKYLKATGHRLSRRLCSLFITGVLFFGAPRTSFCVVTAATDQMVADKPYRVLLVVEQWGDPMSNVVGREVDSFQPLAALLKAWSIPFDILRLDQQRLDASYLFQTSGVVRYGAILWMADLDSYEGQNLDSLEEATHAGTGFIAIHSRLLDPVLERIAGQKFLESYTSSDPLRITQPHFLLRDSDSHKVELPIQGFVAETLSVLPSTAKTLVEQGSHPVVTVHPLDESNAAVWLGIPGPALFTSSAFWRDLLFQSLVLDLGFVVTPDVDYAHAITLELDDWGTSDKGFLSYWHDQEPNEEALQRDLILPLKRHHFTASVEVNSGFVDRHSKRILSPWGQKFRDSYGFSQDYASTRRGLIAGADAGILDIESHGWSHMQPDLESAPGPWWTANPSGEGSVLGWYAEFWDQRRGKDIPAATQVFHMKQSLAALRLDFGRQPLEIKPGNNIWSHSQFTHTAALAARLGFGIFHGGPDAFYLDQELVLDMAGVIPSEETSYDSLAAFVPSRWSAHPDGPVLLTFHDRDVSLDHNFIEKILTALPGDYHALGTNQYVAILHTAIDGSLRDGDLRIGFAHDPHYCAYFASHSSSWQLWTSDAVRQRLNTTQARIAVDGKPYSLRRPPSSAEPIKIELPAGAWSHELAIAP